MPTVDPLETAINEVVQRIVAAEAARAADTQGLSDFLCKRS